MSLGQDLLDEMVLCSLDRDFFIEKNANAGIWITAKGEKLNIKDMSDSHIMNTIALIERKDKTDTLLSYKIVFIEELNKRGVKHNFEP